LYISLDGDLKDLEQFLIDSSPIINPILDCLFISNLEIIVHNPLTKKSLTLDKVDCSKKKTDSVIYPISNKDMKAMIQEKEKFTNLKDYFSQIFLKNKELNILQSFEQKCEELNTQIGKSVKLKFFRFR